MGSALAVRSSRELGGSQMFCCTQAGSVSLAPRYAAVCYVDARCKCIGLVTPVSSKSFK